MTIELALAYIPKRMKELGYEDEYGLRLRHYVLKVEEEKIIEGDGQLFILIAPQQGIRIQSAFGIYDIAASHVNELQYEHEGRITLNNYSTQTQHIRFIQIIPKK
jgi:hypothetical protein